MPTAAPSRPAPTASPEAGPEALPARTGPGLVALAAVVAVAVAWAASRSGASATGLGRALGRLDGGIGVLLVGVGALAQRGITDRALAGAPVRPVVDGWRRRLRDTLVPWWLVVTVATFLYPLVGGAVLRPPRPTSLADATAIAAAETAALPTWVDVVRDWLLLAPLTRPVGPELVPPAAAGRLGLGWVVTVVVAVALVLPLWERALRRVPVAADPVRRAVAAGAVLAAGGFVLRLVLAATSEPLGWGAVARTSPPAQLDLLGVGIVLGALVAGARHGTGPLVGAERVVRTAAPRLGGVVALALLAGAAGPDVGTTMVPLGVVDTAVARTGLALVGAAAVLWGLLVDPAAPRRWWSAGAAQVGTVGRALAGGTFLVIPLATELWVTRAGGPPGTQRLGPMVLVTVAGALAGGLAVAALLRLAFGADLRRRLTPLAAGLATITTGALAWRLLTLVSINRTNPSGGDPFYYHHQANMLADRVGYSEPFRWVEQGLAVPSAIHPPLLSTWLALGSGLGARTFLAHKTLTAVLSVLVVVVAALVARRLAGDRAALVTAVLVAVYPNLWVIDGALWPEGVYTTMCGLAVLAAYRWWERPDLRRAALLGAVIAVAALARGEALFLYPLLVAPLFLLRRGVGLGRKVAAGATAGVCGLLLLAPWTVRNVTAFDQVVTLSTNSDEVLYYANCADSYGLEETRPQPPGAPAADPSFLGYWSFNCQQRERARAGMPVTDPDQAALYRECLGDLWTPELEGVVPGEPPGNEADKAKYWRCLGVDYARENVDRLPVVALARIGRELDVYRPDQSLEILSIEGRPEGAARLGRLAWWVLAPVGVVGWLALRRRRVLVYPLVSLGLMVLVTTVYAYGAVRFRTPLELALLIGAGVVGEAVWRRLRPEARIPDAPHRPAGTTP
ncbi:glycosyltransferase family 39 protein [Iamia majanohamensis]|uniref:Glycosyltransferase family 39 protein n=1 Tax=Iamia majanohamensis TaxID=467976 RepID=A0AAE9Y6F0_9ACTN|nr:glycosyltransferase family 39 protein [Iamia majanohamensis]WCO65069.1 glycosyltransferase family 39 protein [Iamia majanohamensis]